MFNLSAFLSYVFVVTFRPGPNNVMSMANGSKLLICLYNQISGGIYFAKI
ncbi:hypothetical protein [Clostridium sp. DL1XJH146]